MLELKDLVFEVPVEDGSSQTKRIIDGLSLTIDDGKFTVITGPNGGGKSTLAKLIMGIEQPTSGAILFNGQDITNASITERAKLGIGYGFQQPARF
ncbi:MAG: ATP-binding cassette domain-containing protein, partial [Slackia sp.]|nr:ATP-binding cassette domain-containing protein [Slackia sp.]